MNEEQKNAVKRTAQRIKRIAKGDTASERTTQTADAEETSRRTRALIWETSGKYPSGEDGLAFQHRIRDEGFLQV